MFYIRSRILFLLLLLFFIIINYSCATEKYLKTSRIMDTDVSGIFTVIYYGYNSHRSDPKTVAILDLEGDQYTFVPSAHDYEYVIKKRVPAKEALEDSRFLITRQSYYFKSRLSKILDDSGQTIGYELRPLYQTHVYGRADILDIRYRIRENKVFVSVDTKRQTINRESYY